MLATIYSLLLWVWLFWIPFLRACYVYLSRPGLFHLVFSRFTHIVAIRLPSFERLSSTAWCPYVAQLWYFWLPSVSPLLLVRHCFAWRQALTWFGFLPSLYSLCRELKSLPSLSLTPGSTVLENVDYDLSAGASSSLPPQPWHSCLLSCSESTLSLKLIHFCGWASHCPDCLLVSSLLLCVQYFVFLLLLPWKVNSLTFYPTGFACTSTSTLPESVYRAVSLQLLLSAVLQAHFWSQPVTRARIVCSPSVHTASRRPLEKMSSSRL